MRGKIVAGIFMLAGGIVLYSIGLSADSWWVSLCIYLVALVPLVSGFLLIYYTIKG